MHALRIVAPLAVALALGGCATGFEQFYQPIPGIDASPIGLAANQAPPQIVAGSGNPDADVAAMFADGYGLIGISTFNGPNEGVAGALAQAKKIGAARVIVASQYARTVSGAVPITMPTTSQTNVSGTVFTPGKGFSTVTGTATSYGSRTTMVPYRIDRYDQTALYFAALNRKGYGYYIVPVSNETARQLGTARAMLVAAVRRGSPAYIADVLPGDIIVELDGQRPDPETWDARIAWGSPHDLKILRNGAERTVRLHISPDGSWR